MKEQTHSVNSSKHHLDTNRAHSTSLKIFVLRDWYADTTGGLIPKSLNVEKRFHRDSKGTLRDGQRHQRKMSISNQHITFITTGFH